MIDKLEYRVMNTNVKNKIENQFSEASVSYNKYAEVQKESAERLGKALAPWLGIIPEGPVLELGCGTGFLTKQLLQLLPQRQFEITDVSIPMINECKKTLSQRDYINYYKLDAENEVPEKTYALIAHNFVAQWFKDPAYTLERHLDILEPGGLMLGAFPGENSFPQWKRNCKKMDLPYTGNTLPNAEEMAVKLSLSPCKVDIYEKMITQSFDHAIQFFRMLRSIGAHTNVGSDKLSGAEFRELIGYWDANSPHTVQVDWHVIFLAVKKN